MPPLPGLPEGVIAQVRPFLKKTTGYVLANRGDCLGIQRREVDAIKNRAFYPLRLENLATLRFPASWMLGILLCPGDDTRMLAAWAQTLPPGDRARLRFYFHEDADPDATMEAWKAVGLEAIQYDTVSSWQQFHHRFGADHAIRVYQDHVHKRR